MSVEIRPIQRDDVPELSRFLVTGFDAAPDAEFASPDVLLWKYFDPIDEDRAPRCFVAEENGQIVACIGLSLVRFVAGQPPRLVTASHGFDWLAAKTDFAAGLMVEQYSTLYTDVQFGIGGTPKAVKIRERSSFTIATPVPEYCKILRFSHRLRKPRQAPVWKALLQIARDTSRRIVNSTRQSTVLLELKHASKFGREVAAVTETCQMTDIHTHRTPELLNHFLRYPKKNITGWHILQKGHLRGFALLSIVKHGHVRTGRIADCFLDSLDQDLWHAALLALTKQLGEESADMVECYGTTPWMVDALKRNGFNCQRQSPFAFRDPKKLLPADASFYLTHLEADHAYL
jgi:hypothetical protein